MRSDGLLSLYARIGASPRFKIATINRWLNMLQTDTASRRWTAVGNDSIMYVSPRSRKYKNQPLDSFSPLMK